MRADLITVCHNDTNAALADQLFADVRAHEPDGGYRLIRVDNRVHNRGFARACNIGAFHPEADAPIIGFLNPDLLVRGPFLRIVESVLATPTVIAGSRFGKPDREVRLWGLRDWVCGAALFVSRRWFTTVRGFDEQFVWSWEETDLIRRAEHSGFVCRSIGLPFIHQSPGTDTPQDARYKRRHFDRGSQRYYSKWGRP